MTYNSPENVRAKCVQNYGEQLGTNIYWLGNALTNLHAEWKIFRGLFVEKPEAISELNAASGLVSYYFSKVLHDSVLLGLCRMTDPAKTGKKENLSLSAITPLIAEDLQGEFGALVNLAESASEFAREWRNRSIAHADLDVATGAAVVEASNAVAVDDALEKIGAALNYVEQRITESSTIYSEAILPLDDEKTFLRSLHLGNRAWENLLERQQKALQEHDYPELELIRNEQKLPGWVYGTD